MWIMPHMRRFDQKLGKVVVASWLYSALCLSAFSAQPLFVRFSTDRNTIHVGEAFQITMAIHVTGETLDKQISIDALPSPDVLRLYPFEELPIETVILDGHSYEVRKFRAWARAAQSGSIFLTPQMNGTLIQTTRSFFFMQESRRTVGIPVEPATLSILPLPKTGRPADFSGLVGRFTFSVIPSPLNIAPGDLITVVFTIEGDLLPDNYLKPEIKPANGLKTYEVKAITAESTPARHVFNQTVIPDDSSVATLPACSLSYFDSRDARYKTLTAGPFPIRYHADRVTEQAVYTPTQSLSKAVTTNISGDTGTSLPQAETAWSRLWHTLRHEETGFICGKLEIQAYLAPSESSKKLFALKPGTTVTYGKPTDGWVRVSTTDGMGWIPEAAINP